jgi:hypothetical protein
MSIEENEVRESSTADAESDSTVGDSVAVEQDMWTKLPLSLWEIICGFLDEASTVLIFSTVCKFFKVNSNKQDAFQRH